MPSVVAIFERPETMFTFDMLARVTVCREQAHGAPLDPRPAASVAIDAGDRRNAPLRHSAIVVLSRTAMHSRAARLSVSALAWIALGAAAFFTFDLQRQIDVRQSALRSFESIGPRRSGRTRRSAGGAAGLRRARTGRAGMAPEGHHVPADCRRPASTRSAAPRLARPPVLRCSMPSTAMTQVGNVDRHVREQLPPARRQGSGRRRLSERPPTRSRAPCRTWTRQSPPSSRQRTGSNLRSCSACSSMRSPAPPGSPQLFSRCSAWRPPRARTVHRTIESVDAHRASRQCEFVRRRLALQADLRSRPPIAPPVAPAATPPTPASSGAAQPSRCSARTLVAFARPLRRERASGTIRRDPERTRHDRVARERSRSRPASRLRVRLYRQHAGPDPDRRQDRRQRRRGCLSQRRGAGRQVAGPTRRRAPSSLR